ncbi:MAG: DUF2291 family protein [Leucobacter sp.]
MSDEAKTLPKRPTQNKKRLIWGGIVLLAVVGTVLGTKVVPNDVAQAESAEGFNAETYGADNFSGIQEQVTSQAVDAAELAEAIAADPESAAGEFAVESSGGPVFSVTFTGIVGEGQSGIYEVAVEEVPDELQIRMQTGPAINGTELRDATGEIHFGQFTNQIEFQDAASALNEELKVQVLDGIDVANLSGETVTVTGAFTLVNPAGWLITPVSVEIQ